MKQNLEQTLKEQIEEKRKLSVQLTKISKCISDKDKNINIITQKINNMQGKKIIVSDHAVVRYLERCTEYDVDNLKNNIIVNNNVRQQINVLGGSGKFTSKDYKLVVNDYIVSTILNK